MATDIRFGNNVFQKERKILLLEQELSQLQSSYTLLQSQYSSLLQSHSASDRSIFLHKQEKDIQNIELITKTDNLNRLQQEKELWLIEKSVLEKENIEYKKMNEKLRENIDQMGQKLDSSIDLESRLKQEILVLEGFNEKLEKKAAGLKKAIDEKTENIEILEKSVTQKDKFNAIIVKEKERLMKLSPFEGFLKDKKHETKPMILTNKENIRKIENKSILQKDMVLENDNIEVLRKKLKQTELEMEKIKKQNCELVIRLKNKKN